MLDIQEARERRQLPVQAHPPNPAHRLHPAIYMAIAALALLFAASVWGFFAPSSRNYLLAIVTGFVLAAVGLPFQLWRVQRHGHDPRDTSLSPRPLAEWLNSDIEVWGSRMRGRDAAAAILLPIAAGAFGMLCFAVVLHIAVG
jgi:hypothetical protein